MLVCQKLIYCAVCCQPFHVYCLPISSRLGVSSDATDWCCEQCRHCQVCGLQQDDNTVRITALPINYFCLCLLVYQPAFFRQLLCHRQDMMWTLWKAFPRTKRPKKRTLEHYYQFCKNLQNVSVTLRLIRECALRPLEASVQGSKCLPRMV